MNNMTEAARALLARQGRTVESLFYTEKVHPKSGEVAHLFRGKERGRARTKAAQPKNSTPPSDTVRFVGVVDEHGVLVDLHELGSAERKRVRRRGPVAGRVKVPHHMQRRVRRATELARSPESGRGRTGPSGAGTASPAQPASPSESPPPRVGRPSDP